GLGLEPGEVVADRRLRIVQLLRCRGDRSTPGEGIKDPQPRNVQHSLSISMDQHEVLHWTYESIGCTLRRMTTTQTRPVSQLTDLVDGVRTAVAAHANWP